MAYNKIKLEDQVILDLSQDDVSSDTSLVMQGIKYHGNDGVQYVGTGTGGERPQLFAPVVTYPKLNQIAWERDTRNGSFGDYVAATIDGAEVTSPYDITEEDDGKTIVITSMCDGFDSNSLNVNLSYIQTIDDIVIIRDAVFAGNYPYLRMVINGARIDIGKDTSNLEAHYVFNSDDMLTDNDLIIYVNTTVKTTATVSWNGITNTFVKDIGTPNYFTFKSNNFNVLTNSPLKNYGKLIINISTMT